MAAARLAELGISRRNLSRGGALVEGPWSRRTFPFIVALHSLVIGATLVFGSRRPRRSWLALLLAVQPLRLWILVTLGQRWNARAAVPAAMEVETGGPYAFVRHPNYTVVGVEIAALPAAFGLFRLAALATVANAALLALRIREEEAGLMRLPGYGEHFGDRPRFLPFLI